MSSFTRKTRKQIGAAVKQIMLSFTPCDVASRPRHLAPVRESDSPIQAAMATLVGQTIGQYEVVEHHGHALQPQAIGGAWSPEA